MGLDKGRDGNPDRDLDDDLSEAGDGMEKDPSVKLSPVVGVNKAAGEVPGWLADYGQITRPDRRQQGTKRQQQVTQEITWTGGCTGHPCSYHYIGQEGIGLTRMVQPQAWHGIKLVECGLGVGLLPQVSVSQCPTMRGNVIIS